MDSSTDERPSSIDPVDRNLFAWSHAQTVANFDAVERNFDVAALFNPQRSFGRKIEQGAEGRGGRVNELLHGVPYLKRVPGRGIWGAMRSHAKSSVLRRLNRIEGQVRGLSRMVEHDRYCIDIITQLSAARAALRRAEEEILADHVANCVEHAIASGNKAEQRRKITELMNVLSRAER